MITVAVTDDHPLIQNGIRDLLSDRKDMSVMAAWGTAQEAREGLEVAIPNVLLLDINLPDEDGIILCSEFAKAHPEMAILALTTFSQAVMVRNMMKNGAKGYLLKSTTQDELVEAIVTVANGGEFLQSQVKELLLQDSLGKPTRSYIPKLTRREKEVLALIVEEMTTVEIAEKLFVSPKTVESHRLNLIQKMGVRNTAGMVKEAINKGLV